MNYKIIITTLLILLSFSAVIAQNQKINLPLNKDAWVASEGATLKFDTYEGRQAVYVDRKAFLKDFEFENGTLEIEIAANKKRSFAGLIVRANNLHSEEVYLRMHKSNMPDAIQYTPVFNGESNWQLYKELQNKTSFKTKGWNHLKLVVYEGQAIVFVNGTKLLEIGNLRTDNSKGSIGIFGLFGNWFTNLTYSSEVDATLFPIPLSDKIPEIGLINEWQLSNAYPATPLKNKTLLEIAKTATFKSFKTEKSGLLPISKFRKKTTQGNFERNKEDFVIAKLVIHSDKQQRKKFYFDYSDKAQLYLNEDLLFEGNNAFRSKGIQHTGHIGLGNSAIYLNLKEGKNELICVVIEKANGWGLMGQFKNLEGIEIK